MLDWLEDTSQKTLSKTRVNQCWPHDISPVTRCMPGENPLSFEIILNWTITHTFIDLGTETSLDRKLISLAEARVYKSDDSC